jgi:hypothetical protein
VLDAAGALAGGLGRDQLHDPGTAGPSFLDVIRRLFGSELPAGIPLMAFLVIRSSERDLAFSLKLAADLAIELGLVGLDGQGDVGAMLETPAKNACVVCRASAWISLPSSSIVLSSSLSAACSLDSCVS